MVGVPPAGPSTVTVRACGSTETIFALICLVLAMITPGIAPLCDCDQIAPTGIWGCIRLAHCDRHCFQQCGLHLVAHFDLVKATELVASS